MTVGQVHVGGLDRAALLAALEAAGVRRNESADLLLAGEAIDRPRPQVVDVVLRTVGELGFPDGASLSAILARAPQVGLALCPPATGPYLRLAMADQESAPDSVMSNGSAPSASVTVAAAPPVDDFPKGFYVRMVDGVPWLRGYRCTDEHVWSPGDRLAFRRPAAATGPNSDHGALQGPSGP